MFNRLVKALLITTLFLTGCASSPLIPTASRATASRQATTNSGGAYALMPVAQDTTPTSNPGSVTRGLSSVSLLGQTDLTEDEIAEDGYDAYGILATDSVKGYSGMLRRTETAFVLESTTGLFNFNKKTVLFTLQALNNDVANSLQGQENRKVLVKAEAAANNTLVVHSIKRLADLGFLFNWYSKGKVSGIVKDYQGHVLAGVIVRAMDTNGYLMTATTESNGEFALKNATPGAYTLSFTKGGYLSASSTIQINRHKTTNVSATLVPVN